MVTITTRSDKGSPLTNDEVDANFNNLNTKVSGIEASADVTDTANVVAALTAGTNVAIASDGTISATDTNTTYSVGDGGLSQNNFTDADHTKLNAIEALADVTDTANVVAALTAGTNVAIASDGTISATDTNTTYSVGDGGLSQINFTSADHTKLDGIETSATTDQTAAQILTAVKTVDGASSGLDADLLDGQQGSYYTSYTDTAVANIIESSPAALDTLNELAAALGDDANFATTTATSLGEKLPKAGGAMTGAITTNSTFDGRGVATDGAKLDGIEVSADVTDTTNVVAALTAGTNVAIASNGTISATDTNTTYSVGDGGLSQNNFTDADHTKLDGIAASATNTVGNATHSGEVTGSGVLTIASNVVDADNLKVTGNGTTTQFLRSDGDGTFTWAVPTDTNTTYSVGDGGLSQNNFTDADHTKLNAIEASADVTDTTNVVAALTAGTNVAIASNGTISATDTNTTYSVGDGGLSQNNFTDADHTKLNTIEASADVTDTANVVAALTAGTNVAIASNGTISSTDTNTTYSVGDGALTQVNFTSSKDTKLTGIETNATADQTAAQILTAIKTVDGAGSGLDADLLDGNSSAAFATAAQGTTADAALAKTGGAMTGAITTNSTFDGRDVATDGTKLDGIASGATANVGDITGVTAGTALSGGGASGAVTLNVAGVVSAQFGSAQTLIIKNAAGTALKTMYSPGS